MTAGRSRVVLHIGGQKCGSSALQGYLFFGRYKLAAAGITYLDMDIGTDPGRGTPHSALIQPVAEDEIVVQRRRVADAIRNTPGLDAYSGLRA